MSLYINIVVLLQKYLTFLDFCLLAECKDYNIKHI